MENFIEELSNNQVISRADILLLKQYISKKYVNYTSKEKSNVLSRAVYQVLDKSVHGLNQHYVNLVKKDILKDTILKNGDPVFFSDILKLCVSPENKSRDFEDTLLNWINLHIKNKISKTDLEIYSSCISSTGDKTQIDIDLKNIIKSKSSGYTCNNRFNTTDIASKLKHNFKPLLIGSFASLIIIFFLINCLSVNHSIVRRDTQSSNISSKTADIKNKSTKVTMLVTFNYKEINRSNLKKFLTLHDSLLAEEPYFSTIISVSKQYNLNPFILFAITGQEEGFVSKQNPNSIKIANNPYNVYHSWQKYNTDIKDASEIASLTVINLSKDMPEKEETFHWINRQYAEDPNWSKGVKTIYQALEKNNSNLQ